MILIQHILSLLNIPYTKQYLRKIFVANPNKDNLLGFANIFTYYGVKTQAVRVNNISFLSKEILPCLAALHDKFVIIEGIKDGEVKLFTIEGYKYLTAEDFEKEWNGVLLLLERTEHYGEPFFNEHRHRNNISIVSYLASIIFMIAIIMGLNVSVPNSLLLSSDIVLSFLGLFCSILILKVSFSVDGGVYKICTISSKFDCRLQYKLFGRINLYEICISYFITLIISLVTNISYGTIAFYIFVSLFFVIWSAIYQLLILKKYCPLCILIQICLCVLCAINYNFFLSFGVILY